MDDNINSFNTTSAFNPSANSSNIINVNTGGDNERDQIWAWLSPALPWQRHQGVRTTESTAWGASFWK
ncbi:hypothetical protein L873DRAFT_1816550 [Choiromyces venosus 120613-1]|uniref:Uncharacterized protein n=1 Tax=Choiromyces venosus 120613-1 TaxID=1336337 RepID=A0A3N4J482_9PEZI|nr:hypothetical protein L873DRAFT_1816550 [Choiromyces venosus 120613-1]